MYLLHCIYQRVLPPLVGLPVVPVALPGVGVPLWAGVSSRVGLPVPVHSTPRGLIEVVPSLARGGGRQDVLPHWGTVLLICSGGRGVVALVVGRLHTALVGDGVSGHGSGVGGVVIWIPPGIEIWKISKL